MGWVSSSRSSFSLWAITFICIYKHCAAKTLNVSVAWHVHTCFYTLNSRDLEMFVCFCQHLTVIIFNHSHTCLSLKIVLTLPSKLLQSSQPSQSPIFSTCPLLVASAAHAVLWLVFLPLRVDTPESFLRIWRPLLVRVSDFIFRSPPVNSCTWKDSLPLDVLSHSSLPFLALPICRGEQPKSQAVSDLWDGLIQFLKWNISPLYPPSWTQKFYVLVLGFCLRRSQYSPMLCFALK